MTITAIVSFLVVLTVLVFVHEMGHYLIARKNGVRVEVFSVGFGPEIIGWTDNSLTRWKICAIPLGGYVKMFGDSDPASTKPSSGECFSEADVRVSFHHKSLAQKTAIVAAGPIANFLFATDSISAGIFLGASIHETAQVVGAGMMHSQQYSQAEVLEVSTLTKLVRNTAMIFVIPYMAYQNNSQSNRGSIILQIKSIFPFFILGFIGFGILRTLGDIGINKTGLAFGIANSSDWESLINHVVSLSKFFLVVAMSAIGLSTDMKSFKSIGINVFYFGFVISFLVGLLSLVLIFLFI